ncbi:hypothetical protein [Aureimonas psammosilenae]|uniref:hypothetical protein n=1 Tax=Aureimonas psammosilenae TaxID=2495496 RepID=UPI001260414A|nr:hypothetical protein [Aureimonas psammosilenae]
MAAWEEDAVFDLLRNLTAQHGGDDQAWLAAIACEAQRGTLEAYRHGARERTFDPVDAARLASEEIGNRYDRDTIYLSRTEMTLLEIEILPPPPADSSQWVIGLWGQRPAPQAT